MQQKYHRQCLSSASSVLRRLRQDASGSMAIIAAITLIPIAIAVTAAVDLSNAIRLKTSLQAATDAGVLAAATALASGHGDVDKQKIAVDTFYANLSPMLVEAFATAPEVTIDFPKQQVHMEVQVKTDQLLTHLITDSMQLRVQATAMVDKGSPVCLIVLNPTAEKSLDISGTADVVGKECSVHVNSNHDNAMHQTGAGSASAESFCVHGDYSGSNYSPQPRRHCMREKDPLAEQFAADLAAQDLTSCKGLLSSLTSNVTLTPGVYCGGLEIKQGIVTMLPGVYVVRDGEFNVQANGKVIGLGVTILLTGNNARFSNQAGADISVSAPTSGAFAGIVLAQDPSSVHSSQPHTIIGGGQMHFEGIVYFPKQSLKISGNGVIGADSKQLAIFADTIAIQGNGVLTIKTNADQSAGQPKLPEANQTVRLVQ